MLVILCYIILGLFSIVLYTALFADALIFIILVIVHALLAALHGKAAEKDECYSAWAKCISFTFYIPIRLYKAFNEIYNITICK